MLAAGGARVTLIGRPRVLDELAGGLVVSAIGDQPRTVHPQCKTAWSECRFDAPPIVLVTVKSAHTDRAGASLAEVLPPATVVVSLQNGVRNAATLRARLAAHHVLAAMVPFNVVRRGPGHYHRASSGVLRIADDAAGAPFIAACASAGLPIEPRSDMDGVQWAKLVMNLNNAVNALSGLPLASELAERGYRRCLAASQREALAAIAAADQPLAKLTAIPPRWMPRLLELPDFVFARLARRVIAIDPSARSSMLDDLIAGRTTEIDDLQGEIVRLAARHGLRAPVCARLCELIHLAEAGGRRDFTGDQLVSALAI